MTRDEAVGWVQFQLGSRSDHTTRVQSALIAAQEELERRDFLPWFLLVEMPFTLTEQNDARVPIPANFIREWEDSALYVKRTDDKFVALAKDELDNLTTAYEGATPSLPCMYALDNLHFRVFPTPDMKYAMRMMYYGHDTVLDENIENKWLKEAPWMVISEALMLVAPGLRDTAAYKFAESKATASKNDVVRASEAREQAQRRYVMGGPL